MAVAKVAPMTDLRMAAPTAARSGLTRDRKAQMHTALESGFC
jgi:hypothetical protein